MTQIGAALNNAAQVLATGVERVNSVGSGTLTTDTAIAALTDIVKTQSVWQGDAIKALEDSNINNDWLSFDANIGGASHNITFTPVKADGTPITTDATGYAELQGYKLRINDTDINSNTHRINWYETNFKTDGSSNTYSSASAPVENLQKYFSLAALKNSAGSSDALTFEVTKIAESVFKLTGEFAVGNKITISGASGSYTVEDGKTSSSDVVSSLKTFLASDNTFTTTNGLTAIDLGEGKLSIVGSNANSQTIAKEGVSDGVATKTNSSTEAIISAKGSSPIIRKDNGLIDNDVAANVFTWGGLADGASVGVVVPTRFGISASDNQREQFEGSSIDADNDGNKDGTEFDFTISREGNAALSVDIGYEVKPNATLTAEDFDGNALPSGTIVFGPNETSKTLTIKLNNDTDKEGKESFDVKLVDKYGTAQILNDMVSRTILDDDPTNPILTSNSAGSIDIVAGTISTIPISIDVDYFDQSENAKFSISSKNNAGTILFDGKNSENTTYSFTELKNALSKISFNGNLDEASGSSKITVTDTTRNNSGESTLLFTIHNAPKSQHLLSHPPHFKRVNSHQ